MASDHTRLPISSFRAQTELELLQLLMQDEVTYPWNPADPDSDAYFADLEQELMASGWLEDDLVMQGQAVAATLEQVWATVPSDAEISPNLAVFQQFSTQVPQQLLDRILQQAKDVVASNLSLAEQLVYCVRGILPEWGDDDLQVLARPFAYAMRGAETEMLEAALRSVRCAAWTELSGIEQARLSLAIARYAIAQSPSSPSGR